MLTWMTKHRWHRPKRYAYAGVNRYDTCECGARRVKKYQRGYSAVKAGWPAEGTGWREQ